MGNVKEKLNAEERAYRLLTETIKQSYKPGDFILESSLAIDFGMSRTPISIALNRLVSEGILKKVPKKGSYIPLLEHDDAHNVFSIRKLLEVEALRIVTERNDYYVLSVMNRMLEDSVMALRYDDIKKFVEIDEVFHLFIVKMAYNTYLLEAWKRIFLRCNIYTRYYNSYQSCEDVQENMVLSDHQDIYYAMQNGEVKHATELLGKHIDKVYEDLCRKMKLE